MPERMEMLGRSWNVYFPHDLTVRESSGAFRPNAASGDQGFLTQFLQNAATVTAEDIGWKLLEFLGVIVVAALCVRGYLRWGASGIVGAMAVVAVIAVLWLTTLFTSGTNHSAIFFAIEVDCEVRYAFSLHRSITESPVMRWSSRDRRRAVRTICG